MSLAVNTTDEVTKLLMVAVAMLSPRQIQQVVGLAASNLVKLHFADLEMQRPNKLGGKRTHFYADCARGTSWQPVADTGVLIAISAIGIAARYFGADIKPKGTNKKTGKPLQYLTIAVLAAAYGRTAGDFNNLVVRRQPGKPLALVQADATHLSFGKRKKDGSRTVKRGSSVGGLVFFILVKSARIPTDKSLIPTAEAFAMVIGEALSKRMTIANVRRNGWSPPKD